MADVGESMIRIEEASIETGNFLIENVSLYIPQGAYAVLMGKTGSGNVGNYG